MPWPRSSSVSLLPSLSLLLLLLLVLLLLVLLLLVLLLLLLLLQQTQDRICAANPQLYRQPAARATDEICRCRDAIN